MISVGAKQFSQFHPSPLPIDVTRIKQADGRKLYASDTDIFASYREFLVAKESKDSESNDESCPQSLPRTDVKILRSSSNPITCVGLANKSYLICTCSDDAVHVWKKDTLLHEWGRRKVVRSLGKVLYCTMFSTSKELFICLSKPEEIVIVRCISHVNIEPTGSLDFAEIDIYVTIEKIKEPNIWVGCFFMNDKLHIVGMAQGTGVSLRMWEVSNHKDGVTAKLLDHKTVVQIKSVAAADFTVDHRDVYLLTLGQDGQMEVYLLLPSGFSIINRGKIDDLPEDCNSSMTVQGPKKAPQHHHQTLNQTMKAEFRVLNGRFIPLRSLSVGEPKVDSRSSSKDSNSGNESDENNDNKLMEIRTSSCLCPRLLAVVASTRKIHFVNLRSGEVEQSIKYEDLGGDIGVAVSSVTVAFDRQTSQLSGAMQLMMDKNLYFFKVQLNIHRDHPDSPMSCYLLSSENFNTRSVLRKKLKSPRNTFPKVTKSMTSSYPRNTTTSFPAKTISSTGSFNCTPAPSTPQKTSFTHVDMIRQGKTHWGSQGIGDSPRIPVTPRGGHTSSLTVSPRSSSSSFKVNPHASYTDSDILRFETEQSFPTPIRLAESGISSIRIGSSHDGKLIAVGANVSPLVVMRTQPTLENVRMYKDTGRVSSLHFAFNTKHLLVASNDCKTTVTDWMSGRELLKLKFTSKFNELVASQFYFLDKFILQPEENRLVLYSYAIRDGGNVSLKAGSFILNCQNITAIAAANQFYSNFVICGLSSKCLQVFDANVEKVALTIPQGHTRPITCIRLNEAPKSAMATTLCNYILTSAPSHLDPIKLWDLRAVKCATRIGDVQASAFVATARPALSPCGRYIASGFEDNRIVIYDVRKVNSRVHILHGIRSTVLDCAFDPNFPLLWCAGRNGTFWNFYAA